MDTKYLIITFAAALLAGLVVWSVASSEDFSRPQLGQLVRWGRERETEVCSNGADSLTLLEARRAAREGECGDRLGSGYMCNENTGTWWLDLEVEREGCSPACVVDVETTQATINWRCTGLVE